MSLTGRKPRPISRSTGHLRDDRLFIIACDDTYAPRQYFDSFKIPRIQIHVVVTKDGRCSASDVLERLLAIEHEPDDERWLLLDLDHYGSGHHLQSLTATLAEARRQSVKVAINKPCFELWLLLHHVEETDVTELADAKIVAQKLRDVLGGYNKTRLRPGHFTLGSVREAYVRAQRLDNSVPGGEIPAGNTARTYKIWESVVSKALPSQLPAEIRALLA